MISLGNIANSFLFFFWLNVELWGARRQKEFNRRVSLLLPRKATQTFICRLSASVSSAQAPAGSRAPISGASVL